MKKHLTSLPMVGTIEFDKLVIQLSNKTGRPAQSIKKELGKLSHKANAGSSKRVSKSAYRQYGESGGLQSGKTKRVDSRKTRRRNRDNPLSYL